jgi:5-(aminomethyl)-3-furanmethanol phosphate kinase
MLRLDCWMKGKIAERKLMRVVVKIGGSLIKEAPKLIDRLLKEFGSGDSRAAEGSHVCGKFPFSILIVPGGGIFADTVRAADENYSVGNDAAHWMAILGMEQYAFYLKDKSSAEATEQIADLPPGVSILFPYRLLRKEDSLPHTWDVSSDTIAAWIAKQIKAVFIKATDVDGLFKEGELIREISATSYKGGIPSCIDPALAPFLLKNEMDCFIVNGKCSERVVQAVYGKPVYGTVIKGNI